MLPDAYQTDVSRATLAFLLARDLDEQEQIMRASGEELLTPRADGVLAVVAALHRGHLAFGDRIETLRLCLDEARHDGYDGKPRELAAYLAAVEPIAQEPPALGHTDDDGLTRATAAILFAFAGSRAWDERYRIAAAFSELFATDLPVDLGENLAGQSVSDVGIASPQFWNGLVPILREIASEGPGVLLGDSLPDVFGPGWPSPFQPVVFEGDEHLQLLVLAFSEAPTWQMRKRLVARHRALLEDEATDLLGLAIARGYDASTTRRLELCVEVLTRARSAGLAAFDAELPPTGARPIPGTARRLTAALTRGDHTAAAAMIRQSLHYVDPVLAPRQWAWWNHQLAGVLSDVGDPRLRAVGAEEAILRIRDALSVYGEAEDPERRLESLALYGRILASRSRGDRASSLTTARECFESARAGFAGRGETARAAQAELNLATVLSELPRPPLREADLAQAQQLVVAAAPTFAQAKDTRSILRTGVVQAAILLRYEQLFRQQDLTTLDLAIELLERVLEQLIGPAGGLAGELAGTGPASGRPDPDELFAPSRLLAQAHLARSELRQEARPPGTTAEDDYAAAIACLRRYVDLTDKRSHPWMWAYGQDLLGTVYFRAASSPSGPDDAGRLAIAAAHHEAALEVFGAEMPAERRHVLVALSSAYFRLGRWSDCRAVLAEATSIGDAREWFRLSEYGQLGEIAELQNAHERYAYALLRCGEPAQALVQLDLGKTRAQRDWHPTAEGLPRLEPTDPRPLVPDDGALVFPLVTPRGTAVWLLTGDPAEPAHGEVLELPDVTESDLRRLLGGESGRKGWFPAYGRFLSALAGARGARGARGVRGAGAVEPAGADGEEGSDCEEGADGEALRAWDQAIDQTAHELSGLLTEPISAALRRKGVATGADVMILPSKWLSILPLHAAWQRTPQGSRRYFGNEFTISYAPSLFVLAQATRREAERAQAGTARARAGTARAQAEQAPADAWRARAGASQGPALAETPADAATRRSLLAVCDPALVEAPSEVADVASHFTRRDTLVLSESSATVAAFLEQAPRFSHIHYACHGAFRETDPWESALYLSEREELTVGELVRASAFQSARLVTLSSCESGVSDVLGLPLEFIGLAGAFLQAGAPCVLSCLWSVEDRATRMLMNAFYTEYLTVGAPPAKALATAQRQLRAEPEYARPYFWAAFVVVGASQRPPS